MSNFDTVLQTPRVKCPRPLPFTAANGCEFTLNIGLFFDGTDNNKNVKPGKVETNIAKLYDAYRDEAHEGYYRHYVSGVGTPFTEIGRTEAEPFGGPAGAGGEARIIYGLIQVLNSVHAFVNNQRVRFTLKQTAALCSDTRVSAMSQDAANRQQRLTPEQKILDDLGLDGGLVGADDRSFLGAKLDGDRRKFFTGEAIKLRQQILTRASRPKIAAVYIDVFGFSRGAAQARVFVTWLHDLMLQGGQLFGIPSYVRMLGLFDTVASVGVTNAIGSAGHNAWATARDLRIHGEVKNCVHYVALHELRTNFPADSVAQDQGDLMPPNCVEHHSPGAHSDVGGGYAAGEQGKGFVLEPLDPRYPKNGSRAVPDDGLKLSNLTLNRMFEAAVEVCAGHENSPWVALRSVLGERRGLAKRFGLDTLGAVLQAVTTYFETSEVKPGLNTRDALRQHGLRYLAWRYRVDKENLFDKLPSTQWIGSLDPEGFDHYIEGQRIFRKQIALLEKPPRGVDWLGDKDVYQGFNPNAGAIYREMKTTNVRSSEVGRFFDAWVHDSYAGFIGKFVDGESTWARITGNMTHLVAEGQRYVRWRQCYAGSDDGLNAQLNSPDMGSNLRRIA